MSTGQDRRRYPVATDVVGLRLEILITALEALEALDREYPPGHRHGDELRQETKALITRLEAQLERGRQ
jgi:hypothetical protein